MKESLTSRVGRIVSGSLNALIDAVENAAPETARHFMLDVIDVIAERWANAKPGWSPALSNSHPRPRTLSASASSERGPRAATC